MADVSITATFHCSDCETTWESDPLEDGSLIWSRHECPTTDEEQPC
ncbi:hypothetical protein [Streptomyces sp. NPDC059071]